MPKPKPKLRKCPTWPMLMSAYTYAAALNPIFQVLNLCDTMQTHKPKNRLRLRHRMPKPKPKYGKGLSKHS